MLLMEFLMPPELPRKYLDLDVSVPMFNRFYAELIRRAENEPLERISTENYDFETSKGDPLVVHGYYFTGFRGYPGLKVFVWDASGPQIKSNEAYAVPVFWHTDTWKDGFHRPGLLEYPSRGKLKTRQQLVELLRKARQDLSHEFMHYLQWLENKRPLYRPEDIQSTDVPEHDDPVEVEAYTHEIAVEMMWEVTHSKTRREALKKLKRLNWDSDVGRFIQNILRKPKGIMSWFVKPGALHYLYVRNYLKYLALRLALIHKHVSLALAKLPTKA